MGTAVVHMMKIKSGGVRGIQSHNNREHPPHTNPDIDPARTSKNYQLRATENYQQTIKKEIVDYAPGTKTVRKDAVVLCNFIVTSDEQTMKAMSPEKQRQFFLDTVDWFSNRYGHLVNATIHLDEKTPHMHVGLVPIIDGKLCAKKLFTPKELSALQTDFVRDVGEEYGLERGEVGSERTHLSEVRFKTKCAEEQAREADDITHEAIEVYNDVMNDVTILKSEAERLRIECANMSQETRKANKVLNDTLEQKNAIQDDIDVLRGTLTDLQEKAAIMDEAIKKKDHEGVTVSGGINEWQKRIADAKEKAGDINRLHLLERFVSHPKIKPIFDEFCHTLQRSRGFDRNR